MKTRINVSIGEWALKKARAFCADRDLEMSDLVEQSVRNYIDQEIQKERELYGSSDPKSTPFPQIKPTKGKTSTRSAKHVPQETREDRKKSNG